MKFDKIMAIMDKEFDEIMKNKLIMASLLLMPLIFALIVPTAMVAPIAFSPDTYSQNESAQYTSMIPAGSSDSIQVALIKFFIQAIMPLFMMLPAMLPSVISAYSIIGEKRNRTLEPLLAAPVSEYEIMIGKTLSAIIPALLATWLSALILFGVTALITYVAMDMVIIPDPYMWAIGLLLLAPALAFFAIMCTIMISSRVNDPRVAQQISVVFIIPIMAVFLVQFAGLMVLDVRTLLIFTVIVLVADVISLRIGKAMFAREEILTRWK